MKDAQGRTIDYLRISLTDLCNFRCSYCMPLQGVPKLPREDILRHEEMAAIVRLMVERLGIRKVRVTGGEPLVRKGVVFLLQEICRIPGLRDVAITTNGYLLEKMAAEIYAAGVKRLNISLDTLRRDRFREIARVDGLERVLRGIDAARQAGFRPIKLNTVAMLETLDEVGDFVAFALEKGLELRFIERMPFTPDDRQSYVPIDEVRKLIETDYELELLDLPSRTRESAVRYRIGGTETICGFISPVSAPFCDSCNRLRLRVDGKLVPCLKGPTKHDLMPYVRPVLLADELVDVIRNVVAVDPKEHSFSPNMIPMSQLGG